MDNVPRSARKLRGGNRSRLPVNPLFLLLSLIVGFSVVIVGGFYLLTSYTVTVVIDGNLHEVRTHQTTVAALLTEMQEPLNPQDIVSPANDSLLQNGLTVRVNRAHEVVIDADGRRQLSLTQVIDPRAILNEMQVKVEPDDIVEVDNSPLAAQSYTTAPRHIQVTRATTIRLDDNGTLKTLHTARRSVGDILYSAGIALYVADSVVPDLGAPPGNDNLITIRRSIPITIQVDGRSLPTRTHAATVGAALAEAHIALIGLDYAQPDPSSAIAGGLSIHVVRVSEDEEIERAPIDFKHVSQVDPTLPIDTRQVIQPGVPGIRERRVMVRREDGVEISRSEPVTVITEQPRDEITAIGTLPTLKSLDTPGGTLQYWRVLKMRVASYRPSSTGRAANDPQYGLTATGQKLHKGLVAVDPALIPLGSALYVPGYGTATAADTGGAVQGLVIDLGYGDDDYKEWSGMVDVYLLPPAPPPDKVPLLPDSKQ